MEGKALCGWQFKHKVTLGLSRRDSTANSSVGSVDRPWLRALRTEGGPAMVAYARRHLQGHIQYYGVSGNSRSVARYVYFATYHLSKWLNRRSQRRSMTWKRFGALIRRQLPAARIVHDLYPTPAWMTQTGSRMV